MKPDFNVDLCVIGGGLIGLSTAFEARRKGLSVLVLQDMKPGSASWASGGMIAPAAEAEGANHDLVRFELESCARYPEFIRGVEEASGVPCHYRTEGTLLLALHNDHRADLKHLAQFQQRLGLESDVIDAAKVQEIEPRISHRQMGGLYAQSDRQVEPCGLCRALAVAIDRLGGTRLDKAVPKELLRDKERVVGVVFEHESQPKSVHCKSTLIAAGAWSNDAVPGAPKLPMRPVRGQVLRLRGETLVQHIVRTPDCYIVPRHGGELLIGATAQEAGFDVRAEAGGVLDLLRNAWIVLPGISELEFVGAFVGFRPTLRDGLPALGATGTPGLWIATGHFRHGVMLTPITSLAMAELISEGKSSVDLAPFSPSRFAP